jgi:hypothetical protein
LDIQVELRASKQKVKLKGQVTSQQDNLLNERQSAIEKAQAENATLRNELATIKSDMEDKKKKVNAEQFKFLCSGRISLFHGSQGIL